MHDFILFLVDLCTGCSFLTARYGWKKRKASKRRHKRDLLAKGFGKLEIDKVNAAHQQRSRERYIVPVNK
jgi:hypothetical protein